MAHLLTARWLSSRVGPWGLGLISALYVLPMVDKFWAPHDEGFLLVNAQRIAVGDVPYRDFWSLYTPGQFYLLAGLFQVFGTSLLPGRLLTVILHGLMCGLSFALARRLYGARPALLTWFLCTISLIGRVGTIPWPSWPAVCLALLSLFGLFAALNTSSFRQACLIAGGLAGLVGWFRHDLGVYTWLAGVAALVLMGPQREQSPHLAVARWRLVGFYTMGAAVPAALAILWLWPQGALEAAFTDVIRFPLTVYPQTRTIAWPTPILNPLMLFHQSMVFIEVNQFYLPLVIYTFVAFELFQRWRDGQYGPPERGMLSVVLLGMMWLNFVRLRADIMHLVPGLLPAWIALPALRSWWRTSPLVWRGVRLGRIAVLLTGLLVVPLSVKNIDKYLKNTYKKPWRGQIRSVDFGARGATYIPHEQAEAVDLTVRDIQRYSQPGERMYVGLTWHGDPQGAPLILYFLGQRLPVTAYHETHPGLTDDPAVQRELIASIQSHAALAVLFETVPEGPATSLDRFLQQHFVEVARHGPYRILKPS